MYLAQLKLPNGTSTYSVNNPVAGFNSIGDVLSGLFNIALYIAGFMIIFWFAWASFEYIFAGGGKENLASARKRITFAIVGFIIIILALALKQFVQGIFPQQSVPITPITAP